MARYIDADKMIEDTEAMKIAYTSVSLDGIIKYIEENIAADVQEVRHGKWKVAGMFDDFVKCSCCEAMYPMYNADGKPFDYCPDCGAKMDEVQNG